MLDTVRGMVICGSLRDALAILLQLEKEAALGAAFLETIKADGGSSATSTTGTDTEAGGSDEGSTTHLILERSKNRYRDPSSGGWMDCLVNVRLVRSVPSAS